MEYTTTVSAYEPIVVTIGNFDGIHKGHQYLLHELHALARELGCTPVMLTFSPHTLKVVRPEVKLQCLTTLEEKLALAKQYGDIEQTIIVNFTPEVAAMSAEAFMDYLCTHFQIRGLLVGANFSLGRNRMGDVHFLQDYGQRHQITVRSISLAEDEQMRISSTRIRTLVSEGRVAEANILLGHPLQLRGIVRHGDKRGRLLGVPTANIHPDPQKLLPANGIYAVRVYLPDGPESDSITSSTVYNGVTNVGVRPMFDGKERLVEVHLLDVNLDLYERLLIVEFIAYQRSEQVFPSVDALIEQMARDIQIARQILTTGVSN